MNSKELIDCMIRREEIDRIPVCPPFQGFWALRQHNVTFDDYLNDPKKAASAQISAIRECGFDGAETKWDWLSPVEMLGCEVEATDYGPIPTVGHIITIPDILDEMEWPEPIHDYRFKTAIETARHIIDRVGDDTFLYSSICCPFTLIGELRGVDNLLFDTLSEPRFVQTMLEQATGFLINYIQECNGIDNDAIMLCDPTASSSLISKEDFLRFSHPYIGECIRKVSEGGKRKMLHICGDTDDRLEEIADLRIDVFSMDSVVDISRAMAEIGQRIIILGNIRPETILFSGRPEDVIRESIDCIQSCGGRNLILGAGCDIDVETPLENMRALRKVVEAMSSLFLKG